MYDNIAYRNCKLCSQYGNFIDATEDKFINLQRGPLLDANPIVYQLRNDATNRAMEALINYESALKDKQFKEGLTALETTQSTDLRSMLKKCIKCDYKSPLIAQFLEDSKAV